MNKNYLLSLEVPAYSYEEFSGADYYIGSGVNPGVPYQGLFTGNVFPTTATQDELFEECGRPYVDNLLAGVNGCIFAYGQTGTGKT